MFEGIKDYALEKHIRGLLKQYYARFGLTLEEAKRLPLRDLLEKLNRFLENNKNENDYYINVIHHQEERLAKYAIETQEMKQRMIDLQGENKGLHKELSLVREDNYKFKLENTLYKQMFQGNEFSKDNAKVNDNNVSLVK